VPKRLSNVRFSLIRNTTCLMGHRVGKEDAAGHAGRRVGEATARRSGNVGVAEGASPRLRGEHATAEMARTVAAANIPRREAGDMTGESTAAHTTPVMKTVAA
jgi:hypothetical protein